MTFAYIVAAVVILHFVAGIGYLIYKISSAKPEDQENKLEL